jgi:hypothetical protein
LGLAVKNIKKILVTCEFVGEISYVWNKKAADESGFKINSIQLE